MSNYYEDGRHTPDLRDDFEDCPPGFIDIQHGRLGLNKYSDNDSDDIATDCEMTHNRRNVNAFPGDDDVPDPRFKQKSN